MKPLKPEDQQRTLIAVKDMVHEHFDVEIGDLKAQLFFDAMMKLVGHAAYNQAIGEAQAYMQQRLLDMDIDLHEDVIYQPE